MADVRRTCRPGFFLSVRVLSRLFRRLFLEQLSDACHASSLHFIGEHHTLAEAKHFTEWLQPLRQGEWIAYAKRPFAGPDAVPAYLSRFGATRTISRPFFLLLTSL